MIEDSEETGRIKLNQETARIPWSELQRFFAQGRLIRVWPGQDLIEVALCLARDDVRALTPALETGAVQRVSDQEAKHWFETDALLWALVVKPWILVQEDVACTSGSTRMPAQG